MAKARMISRSISTSRKLARVDDMAALIFTWIQPHTDDYGRLEGDAMTVRAKVCPMRDYTNEQVEKALQEMEVAGLITLYTVNNERYLQVCNFEEHQTFKTDRPRKEEYPKPEDTEVLQMEPTGNQEETKGNKRPRKLTQVKLTQVKIIAPQGGADMLDEKEKSDGAQINKTIELFKEVNPSYTRLYANKTERAALDRLIRQHGLEMVEQIINFLPRSNAVKYAPTITTPVELERGIGKLLAWAQKQRDTGKGKTFIM